MCNYITRTKVLDEAIEQMIREMYLRAQPPVDIDFYSECYKKKILDPEKDKCYEWHYLPEKVQRKIVEDYLEAYGANDQFKKNCEWLLEMFKNGGHRTVFKDIFGTGEKVRTGEATETLDKIIGKENAEKVYDLINDFLHFYRTNNDEMRVRGAIFSCPTSNPKTVIEHWGDEVIIDNSVYKGYNDEDWDYTYKDYINGVCTGEDYLYNMEEDETCDCTCGQPLN